VALAPIVPSPASAAVAGATLAVLGWSFAIDVGWLSRQRRYCAGREGPRRGADLYGPP
jgi:hypothetical protein